jgi:ABC-type multidrug transport system ATPase subunit
MKFRLIVTSGPEAGQSFELDQSEVVIGRSPDAQVVLSSQVVSRYHARIIFQNGRYQLEDNQSANGTFLNGNRLSAPQPLQPGDQINFGGQVTLQFELPQMPKAPKETIALTDDDDQQASGMVPRGLPETPMRVMATQAFNETAPEAIPPGGTPPQIVVTIAGESPQTYSLTSPQISLGREEDNDIVIRSKIISRHHARLERTSAGFRLIVTPGNTNETYVDGQLLSGQQELTRNSLIRIGSPEAGQLVTLQYIVSVSSDSRQARNIRLGTQTKLLIGRDPGNDIVLDAPPVSRFHTEIERVGQRYRVKDLRSLNGTFLNDLRIEGEIWAKPQDTVRVGPYVFVLGEDELAQIDQTRGLRLDAVGLQKWVRKDLNLLQNISLVLKPREFVVVVGQSGGGKTTLVDAIAGYRPATDGQVYVNETDLYRHFDAIRSNIGYVPQRDIIHMELTVYQSLHYAALLRMPPDTSAEERHIRIMEVLEELDLSHRKDAQVSMLSGGQQKRVSIGVELLTKPGLFFLDEPTSGLDPGTETSLMQLLRRLADQGRTIVLITHATKNVMLADKVIFLARGGYVTWFGPPDEALRYFAQYQAERDKRSGGMDFDQIYTILDDPQKGSPTDWHSRYLGHPAYKQYIASPLQLKGHDPAIQLPGQRRRERPAADRQETGRRTRSSNPFGAIRQFAILSARNIKILSRDRISLVLMLAAAPLVGMLDFVLASGMEKNPFDYTTGDFSPVAISLFLFSIYGVLVGGLSQMREIVRERAIYRRERLVNLQILPYVLSKMWVAGLLALYHGIAYTVLHYLAFNMPGGVLEFFLIYISVTLATFAGMMMGLFASALAPNSNTVPLLVILLMIPQIVLAGALIPLPEPVTAITSTRWAFQSFIGIAGVGSDKAADPCWDLPEEERTSLTLEAKEEYGCRCMGANALRRESCEFPGLGELYDPAIDEPEPVKPPSIGDPPEKPQIPQPPAEPADPNDPVAMNTYLQQLKSHQEQVAAIQTDYEDEVQAYQQKVDQYQDDLVAYQEDLADWQIGRNEAIAQAEGMLSRFNRLFGWAAVNKEDDQEFTKMLIKTWTAQIIIISFLFIVILGLMKLKDRGE